MPTSSESPAVPSLSPFPSAPVHSQWSSTSLWHHSFENHTNSVFSYVACDLWSQSRTVFWVTRSFARREKRIPFRNLCMHIKSPELWLSQKVGHKLNAQDHIANGRLLKSFYTLSWALSMAHLSPSMKLSRTHELSCSPPPPIVFWQPSTSHKYFNTKGPPKVNKLSTGKEDIFVGSFVNQTVWQM